MTPTISPELVDRALRQITDFNFPADKELQELMNVIYEALFASESYPIFIRGMERLKDMLGAQEAFVAGVGAGFLIAQQLQKEAS